MPMTHPGTNILVPSPEDNTSCGGYTGFNSLDLLILSWFSWDNYGGHPRSLLMPDGSILTGYYVRMFKEDSKISKDIASHVIRWRVPEDWP